MKLGVLMLGLVVAMVAWAQTVREDWPAPWNVVAAYVPGSCEEFEGGCSIAVGWNEPFAAPLPPTNLVGEATGCDSVHVMFEPDWPYPTTTRVYADGVLVGEHPDDKIGFDATGLPRGVTQWALDAYSTKHGVEYVSVRTGPMAIDTRQVCPLAGDCVVPYDDALTLFDVLRGIDVVLGVAEAGRGCDVDCDAVVDVFDVLGGIDVVLGISAAPVVPCALDGGV